MIVIYDYREYLLDSLTNNGEDSMQHAHLSYIGSSYVWERGAHVQAVFMSLECSNFHYISQVQYAWVSVPC